MSLHAQVRSLDLLASSRVGRPQTASVVERRIDLWVSPPDLCGWGGAVRRSIPVLKQPLYINVERFRGGLVFKAHTLVYHSTLGLRVTKKSYKGTSPIMKRLPLEHYSGAMPRTLRLS